MSLVRYEVSDRVASISLDRPHRKNSLTNEMYLQLKSCLNAAKKDPEVRVVCLRGTGGAFCAGNDLEEFRSQPPEGKDAPAFQFLKELAIFPKPVIAAVSGMAVGIGTTMLLLCDLVYAEEGARFSMPFVPLGVVPEGGSTMLLPLSLGYRRASELLFFGEPFSASDAIALGLVNRVVKKGELDQLVAERANVLASLPRRALRDTKCLVRGLLNRGQPHESVSNLVERIEQEASFFAELVLGNVAKEAICAFIEKREPDFEKCDD